MRTNVKRKNIFTHEGAVAQHINPLLQLRRSVLACLLFEGEFYEDGQSIADRITEFSNKVKPQELASLAIEARSKFNLRHVPLLLCSVLAKTKSGSLIGKTIAEVIQRPDELTEFLAIYWKAGRCPVSAQVKRGLAHAFRKFNAYQLAKYNRDGVIKLRDVLFICHAKPKDSEQEAIWKKLVDGTLESPDTWEVSLSSGADKKATFERLMAEKQLGVLAFLRNLRNMEQAGISKVVVKSYSEIVKVERALPFRFIAAARAVPGWEDMIEPMMLRCLAAQERLSGKTAIVVDNSGSMYGAKVSAKSELDRSDAACAVAILVREICDDAVVIGFGGEAAIVPNRRGFALADAIKKGPGGGTYTEKAVALANQKGYDRIIIITDEQSHQTISAPQGKGYVINVASYQNGIGYGAWTHIDGFSEAVIDYIREYERS